jgi:lambda family phage tail tape measure protein
MSGFISAALGGLAALGIGFSLAGVVSEIKSSIEAIDEFNLSVIQMSAILTSLQVSNGTGSSNIADTYRQTRDYAIQTNEALLKIEPSTSLSIKGLQRINLELAKAGVAIDTNNAAQVEGFKNLANAAAVFSQGGQNEVMLQSEIMLLMQGQIGAHSRLGGAISAMVGGDLKTWVEQHKQAGDFLEQMNKVLAGFGPASKDIAGTWSAVKTSFETTVNIIQRGAMQEAFTDVVNLTLEINEYLKSHADTIKTDVKMGWEAVRLTIKGTGEALQVMGGIVQTTIIPLFSDALTLIRGTVETISAIIGLLVQSPGLVTALAVAVASYAVPAIASLALAFDGLTAAIAASMALNPAAWAVLVGAGFYVVGKSAVTALDEIIHKYTSLNLTGEAAYKEELKRTEDANKAWDAVKQKALFAYREGGRMPGLGMQKELGIVKVPNVKQPPAAEENKDDGKFAATVHASHQAYAAYVKAFYEEQAALLKAANAQQEELNKESYDHGLIDLQAYLSTKHKLNEDSLQAEVDAKLKELSTAGSEYETALSAYKKDPTGPASKNFYDADAKVAEAIKAVTEAQSKLALARKTDANETKNMTVDQLRAYQEIQAQMLDMQGQYVAAAQIRKGLDESSNARQALITEAMKGTAGAEAAYWAQEALDQQKGNDSFKKAAAERATITISEISNQLALIDTAEKFYAISTGNAAQQRIELLKQELALLQQEQISQQSMGDSPAAQSARLQTQAAIDGVNEKLLTQQKILSDRTASGGAISALHAIADQAQNLGAQVSGAVGDLFKGMEDALVSFVSKGKLDFKSLADSIISDLIRIAIQQSVTGPLSAGVGDFLKNMFSPSSGGSAASGFGVDGVSLGSAGAPAFSEISFIPQALGGAWSQGVQKFATGGIVQSPTFFQTASGVGVMGEAGDEAIMPLTRTASGHLGVRASGGGQSAAAQDVNVQVNVVNNSGQQLSAKQSGAPVFDGKQWIVGVVLENIVNGGALKTALQGAS